jgi:hypothetical protein
VVRRAVGRLRSGLVAGALAVAGVTVAAAPAYAVDPVAGGQTASPPDTLFPNQGNSGYDVSHYDINFRVDVTVSSTHNAVATTNVPAATATIQAATTGPPLSSYSLDFQGSLTNLAASTFNIDTVTVDGVPATFTRLENTTTNNATTDVHKLVVTPATAVDGAFTTVVTYHGAPVRHQDTDGSSEGWNNTTDGATFLNQPVGSMTLFPNNNTPRDKATFTFTVDAPTMLTTSNLGAGGGTPRAAGVVSNGELISRTLNGDGTRTTWVWDEAKPMASELSLISIGRYDIYESDIHLELSNRNIHEWTFIDPAISPANQNTTLIQRAQLKALLDFYESKYGPYPGNSTGLVTDVVPSAINYALETQDRPFFPNSASAGTTYHEIMHQWWGDSVAPTDWNDIVLNEGPAQYSEFQFPYEGAGTNANTTEQRNFSLYGTATNPTFTVAPAAMTQASQLFGSQVYEKGSLALEALRTSIGAANFETLMRQYQQTYGGGQITGRRTLAFQAMAESISGRNLTAFFQAWYHTAGKPPWPAKFNLNLAGPTGQVNPGDPVTYTLSLRNTGKVAATAGSVVLTVDATDILDDATIGTLPANVTQTGNTLTWSVPATTVLPPTPTPTASVAIPFTVNAATTGNTLSGVAQATTMGGTCLDCTASTVIGTAPISPAPVPTITGGTPTVGVPLSVDTSGWAPGTSFTYQWLIDGTPVPGATSATYTPDGNVVTFPVTVKVTGTLAGFVPVTQTSAATPAGVKGTLASPTPTISGTPQLGERLTVNPGAWEPGTVFTSYSWAANGTTIPGATGPSYVPAVATQPGQTITATVTGTKFGYNTTTQTSAPTAPVTTGSPLVLTPTPIVSGTIRVGVQIQPDIGLWDEGVTPTFQWFANGTPIAGAAGTAFLFTPAAAQLGQALTLAVTGAKGSVVTKTSVATPPVDPGVQVLQPTPSITGTPRANTASAGVQGTWDTGTTRTFKWYADGSPIAGATAASYTPTVAQIGQVLTFEVTSTRAGYTTVIKTSPGKTIVGLAQTLQPTPTITGTPKVATTLTGNPGTWDAGTSLTYQWLAAGTPIGGATGLTYDLTPAELGKVMTFAVTSTKATFETVTKTSAATTAVASGDLTSTPVPTITGTPKVDVPLTAVPGGWDSGVTIAYQWTVDGSDVVGATDPTYTPVGTDAGKVVTVKVTGSKTGYGNVTKESAPTTAVADGDQVLTPTPTITGTPTVAETLTAHPGTWDNGVTFSYQWTVDGTNVGGATGTTYSPVGGDVGKVVTVKVTGSKAGYTNVTKESDPTAAVASGELSSTPTPTITGTPKVAQQLAAVPGTWDSGVTLTYQWTADAANIVGATDSTYTPVPGDLGKVITVKVAGNKPGYVTVTKESAATTVVVLGDLTLTPTPSFGGSAPKVGVTFTADPGTWDAGVAFAYQWTADGTDIPGATAITYAVSVGDLGKAIAVEVTGSKAGYNSVTKTSASSSPIEAGDQVLTPVPTITGTPQVGQLLTAVPGTWDDGVTLAYQWTADATDISGATTSAYTPVPADVGKVIRVEVTGTKAGYAPATEESTPTSAVTVGGLVNTPTPTVSGTPKVAVPLTTTTGIWDDGVTLAYQWTADGTDISGATSSTYTPVAGDVGKVITVKVTGSKAGFTSVTKESAATAAVAKGDLTATPTPTISGTSLFGELLGAETGTWDAGTAFSYQWLVDGSAVAGAVGTGYLLRAEDVGKTVTVAVTGSKSGYNAVTRTSAPTGAVQSRSLGSSACGVDIKGKAKVGRTLRSSVSVCPAGATLRYQWYAGNEPIKRANAATYTIKKKQLGLRLRVLVTVEVPGYTSVMRGSGKTGKAHK